MSSYAGSSSGSLSARPVDPNTGFVYNSLFVPGHNRSLNPGSYMPRYTGHVPCSYQIIGSKLTTDKLRKEMMDVEQAKYPLHGRRRFLSLPKYMPGYTGFVPFADQIIARRSADVAPEARQMRKDNPLSSAGWFHAIPPLKRVKERKLYPGSSQRADLLELYTEDELKIATDHARAIPMFDNGPKQRMSWTRYCANAKKDDLSYSPPPLDDHLAPNLREVAGDDSINVSTAVTLERKLNHYRDTERVSGK